MEFDRIHNGIYRLGGACKTFSKALLLMLFFLVILAGIPSLFAGGNIWLKNDFLEVMLFSLLVYAAGAAMIEYEKTRFKPPKETGNKKISFTKGLDLGLVGGIVAIFLAGLFFREAVSMTNEFPSLLLTVSCGLGGLSFVVLTRCDGETSGLMGCLFGFAAAMFSLLLAYSSPMIYAWDDCGLMQFLLNQLLNIDNLFLILFGMALVYSGSQIRKGVTKNQVK